MDKSVQMILEQKKSMNFIFIIFFGTSFILNFYCMIHDLYVVNQEFTIFSLLNLIVSIMILICTCDILKKNTPKFDRKYFHMTFQSICIWNFFYFKLFFKEEYGDALNMFICCIISFVILLFLIFKFKKTDIKDLFSDEQIQELEASLKN